jgi:hypothetical protein
VPNGSSPQATGHRPTRECSKAPCHGGIQPC